MKTPKTSPTETPNTPRSLVSRRSEREQIITAARLQDPEIGDNAMIASGEWGYWIGSIYVSKADVAKSANTVVKQPETTTKIP